MVLTESFIYIMKLWPLLDKLIVKVNFEWMGGSVLIYGKNHNKD